jgi:hypothetical protein
MNNPTWQASYENFISQAANIDHVVGGVEKKSGIVEFDIYQMRRFACTQVLR